MNDLGNEGIAAEAIENAPLKNGNEYSEICHVDECSVSPTLTPSEEARTQVNGSERPPECRRYTREQLMALKSIALSNVKPPNLCEIIDQDKPNSTLRTKAEKDEEERKPRHRNKADRDRDRGDRDRGRKHDDEQRHQRHEEDWGGSDPWRDYEKNNQNTRWEAKQWAYGEQEQAGDWQEEAEWDNPGEAESLTDGILGGDIRKFEPNMRPFGKFGETKGVEEARFPLFNFNEDLREEHIAKSQAWGKWFSDKNEGRKAEAEAEPPLEPAELPLPVVTAPAPVVAPAPKMAAPSAERPPQPAPGVLGNSVSGMDAVAKASHVKSRHQQHNAAWREPQWEQASSMPSAPPDPQNHSTNLAGRSILSMLKPPKDVPEPPQHPHPGSHRHPLSHPGPPSHGHQASHPPSRGANQPFQGQGHGQGHQAAPKLTVHDLFQIAQGQQMPQMPAMSNAGAQDDQDKARKVARALLESGTRAAAPERSSCPPYRPEDRNQDPWNDPWSNTRAPNSGYGNQNAKYPMRYGTDRSLYEDEDRYGRSAQLTAPLPKAPLGTHGADRGGALAREAGPNQESLGHGTRPAEGAPEEDAGCSQS